MNKFVKGFLSLLAVGVSLTLFMVLLPRISADESGADSTAAPTSTSQNHQTTDDEDGLVDDNDERSELSTSTSRNNQTLTDSDGKLCDGGFPTFPPEQLLLSPLEYGLIGGAVVVGIILMIYACYSCYLRYCRKLQDNAGAILNLPNMVQLPSQFPTGPSFIYKDDGITFINQD